MRIKDNFSLVLGISIPILMILFVAAFIYLPGLFIHPQYNFLYASGGDYYWNEQFYVQDGKLLKKDIKRSDDHYYNPPVDAKLFIYDVASDTSTEVTFEDAQKNTYAPGYESPDGFEIVQGSRGGGSFLFDISSENDSCARYLSGHNVSNKLDIQKSGGSYCGYFHFVGWIK